MTDADFFWKLMAGLSMLLNFLGAVALAWSRFSGKPEFQEIKNNPLRVQEVAKLVTLEHCNLLHKSFDDRLKCVEDNVESLFTQQRESYNKLMESASAARARLHEKIDVLASEVANLKGTIEPLKGVTERFAKDVGRLEGILQRNN